METIFEEMGGTYRQESDYLIPNLVLPAEKEEPTGIWEQQHLRYIRWQRRVLYTNLLTSGKLNGYLAELNRQAEYLFLRLVKQLAEKENVTEELKAADQMMWIGKTNNIRSCAKEIVLNQVIYK